MAVAVSPTSRRTFERLELEGEFGLVADVDLDLR